MNNAIDKIRNSGGRFFGLYTKQGAAYNAQFRNETPNYIMFWDRNNKVERKVAKSSIQRVTL